MVLSGGPCPGSEIHNCYPFYSDGFPIQINTRVMGLSSMYFKGSQLENFQIRVYFCPLRLYSYKRTGVSLFGKVPPLGVSSI